MTKQELQEIVERDRDARACRCGADDGERGSHKPSCPKNSVHVSTREIDDRTKLLDFIAQVADIKAVRQFTSTGCPCGGYPHVDGCLIDIASAAKVKS